MAALELFGERGYEQTTVAAIAERAGVTERTFFRYFADKREVLFDSSGGLQHGVVAAIEAAPDGLPPIEVMARAFAVAGDLIAGDRAFAEQRAAVIASDASLQERELLKLERLRQAAVEALRDRGVALPAAELAAGAGVAVFHVGFARWLADDDLTLAERIREALDDLSHVVVER